MHLKQSFKWFLSSTPICHSDEVKIDPGEGSCGATSYWGRYSPDKAFDATRTWGNWWHNEKNTR